MNPCPLFYRRKEWHKACKSTLAYRLEKLSYHPQEFPGAQRLPTAGAEALPSSSVWTSAGEEVRLAPSCE